MVPMIGLVQVGTQAMADRYAYLPFIGLFIMICWAAADWVQRQHIAMRWLVGVIIDVIGHQAVPTHRQINYWSDNLTLWSHTLQVTSDNFIAENSLGVALEREGRTDEAITHFRAAVALNPFDAASNIIVIDAAAHTEICWRPSNATKKLPDFPQCSPESGGIHQDGRGLRRAR